MKKTVAFLLLVLFASCASSKETKYTASTPAAPIVRTFLGIPLTDSIDFIRWNLTLKDDSYSLHCNYGIGKPNTNGFYNGGKIIELSGKFKKQENNYLLQNGNQSLRLAELNANLLHILNNDNSLMIGNGSCSYTLNNTSPTVNDKVNIIAKQTIFKDSMAFQGRTPCGVPGVIAPGRACNKLKWYIVFFPDAAKNGSGTYKAPGVPWYKEGGRKGTWKIINDKNGRIIYQLNDDKYDLVIYLLKLDDGVLIFTDAKGNLLVGDLDFSYTLNRKF